MITKLYKHIIIIIIIIKDISASSQVAAQLIRNGAANALKQLRCRDITGRLTMQTCLGSPEDPII